MTRDEWERIARKQLGVDPDATIPARARHVTDDDVLEAMEKFGGSFVQKLAELYLLADPRNQEAIRAAWPNYWKQYGELARLDRARQGQP